MPVWRAKKKILNKAGSAVKFAGWFEKAFYNSGYMTNFIPIFPLNVVVYPGGNA